MTSPTQETKNCPYCGEEILKIARKCKHCQSTLTDSGEEPKPTDKEGKTSPTIGSTNAKPKPFGKTLAAIGLVACIAAAVYYFSQPSCDSDSVKQGLLTLLAEKSLFLERNGINAQDLTMSLENITRTSSNDDAKSCQANLILKFSPQLTEELAALAASAGNPNFSDPAFAAKTVLKDKWNDKNGRLESALRYQYTKDAVILDGGLDGLARAGLGEVIVYAGQVKASVVATAPSNSPSTPAPSASTPPTATASAPSVPPDSTGQAVIFQEAAQAPAKWPDVNASSLLKESPTIILENAQEKARFQMLLGGGLDDFGKRLSVSSEIEDSGDFLFGSGCEPHLCSISESAFAINKKTGQPYAMTLNDGKITATGGNAANIPEVLKEWARKNGGKL